MMSDSLWYRDKTFLMIELLETEIEKIEVIFTDYGHQMSEMLKKQKFFFITDNDTQSCLLLY